MPEEFRPSGNAFQDFCTMLGLMTMIWAWAENSLAIAIGVINRHAGPIKGYPEPPLSLSRRLDCLKVALRDIALLKPLQEEGRALVVRFKELGARRHKFVHGAAWQAKHGGFESVGIGVRAGQNTVDNHRFDQADTVRLNAEIAKLQDDAAAFLLRVNAIFS
ncbi:MAG: hypothetical protein ABSC72_11705 [Methylovirgula sp.]|jgi:hypothetical protein